MHTSALALCALVLAAGLARAQQHGEAPQPDRPAGAHPPADPENPHAPETPPAHPGAPAPDAPPPLGPNGPEAALLSNVRQLTTEGEKSGEAYFSPEEDRIIFQSIRGDWPFYQMYTMGPDGGDERLISAGTGRCTCGFFRPGTDRVLWASSHEGPDLSAEAAERRKPYAGGGQRRYAWDFDPHMDLYESARDGSERRRLTDSPGYDAEGSYSPDGARIVFTSNRSGDLELYVMDADGANVRQLTRRPGYDGGPFFSPDGRQVLYRGDPSGNDHLQIFLIDADGAHDRQVTHLPDAVNWGPFFHPSGEFLAFATSYYGGHTNYEIALIRPDGSGMVRLTHTAKFDGLPVFNADGTKLLWTSERASGRSQVFVADFDVAAARRALEEAAVREARRAPAVAAVPAAEALDADIAAAEIAGHVAWLADDARGGRGTGDVGAEQAAAYVALRFAALGLAPGGFGGGYFQHFEVADGAESGPGSALGFTTKARGAEYRLGRDFQPLAVSGAGAYEGPVVFAGYGISAPKFGYDDYATADVQGKAVLILRGAPRDAAGASVLAHEETFFSDLRFKVSNAVRHGARVVLIAEGPRTARAQGRHGGLPLQLPALSGHGGQAELPVLAVAPWVAAALVEAARFSPTQLQAAIDEHQSEASVALDGVTLTVRADMRPRRLQAANVLGVLPGGDPVLAREVVIVGAHYDHLGLGRQEGSLDPHAAGQIHNGADDNASGVAAVLEIAERFARGGARPQRSLLFAAWGAEERGLLGSAYYAEHPLFALDQTALVLNLDMVGRLREEQLIVGGRESAAGLDLIVREYNRAYGFTIAGGDGTAGGSSDHASFLQRGVPALFFFTNIHGDYHKPSDDPATINAAGAARIAAFAADLAAHFAGEVPRLVFQAPAVDPHAAARATPSGGGGVYFGSIPDYAEDPRGLKLSGVGPDSPAEKAGLQGGDVIVAFDGAPIKNIYDFTYALRAKSPGDHVQVVVLRAGKQLTFEATLGRR